MYAKKRFPVAFFGVEAGRNRHPGNDSAFPPISLYFLESCIFASVGPAGFGATEPPVRAHLCSRTRYFLTNPNFLIRYARNVPFPVGAGRRPRTGPASR